MNTTIALICAAGVGARAGGGIPKQYQTIHGQPMLAHTIAAFAASSCISHTYVVIAPDDAWYGELIAPHVSHTVTALRVGGASRAESICNGLAQLDGLFDEAWVQVHDAARPCVTPDLIATLHNAVQPNGVGGLLALPVVDTVKLSDTGGVVKKTLDRQKLWLAQTPQMFPLNLLYNAYADALLDEEAILTDDASVMERAGYDAQLVTGHARNLKVTHAEDFALAQFWLQIE
ncbi:MAG: 2-C-methyl-D-erythritol 4-phosphate cytidylyltransferase [Formosimonas sp.]